MIINHREKRKITSLTCHLEKYTAFKNIEIGAILLRELLGTDIKLRAVAKDWRDWSKSRAQQKREPKNQNLTIHIPIFLRLQMEGPNLTRK